MGRLLLVPTRNLAAGRQILLLYKCNPVSKVRGRFWVKGLLCGICHKEQAIFASNAINAKESSRLVCCGVGVLEVGFLVLAGFGMAWLPFHDDSPGWLLRWIQYVGGALLGAVFLVGTIIALRNRRRAGIIFLSSMPVAVFCLAYPSAGYLVWHSDGGGWFEPPKKISYSHRVDNTLLSTDLCGTAGHSPQEARRLSVRRYSLVGGDCV